MKAKTLGRKYFDNLVFTCCDASSRCSHHIIISYFSIVRATFLQNFGIAGGPNGVMNRSEEVVQINVVECASYLASGQTLPPDTGLSPRALAGTLTRKLRRKENQSDVAHPLLIRTETV